MYIYTRVYIDEDILLYINRKKDIYMYMKTRIAFESYMSMYRLEGFSYVLSLLYYYYVYYYIAIIIHILSLLLYYCDAVWS